FAATSAKRQAFGRVRVVLSTANTSYIAMPGPRGGVVTQRTANPRTPVQFRAWPPPAFAEASAGEAFEWRVPTEASAKAGRQQLPHFARTVGFCYRPSAINESGVPR